MENGNRGTDSSGSRFGLESEPPFLKRISDWLRGDKRRVAGATLVVALAIFFIWFFVSKMAGEVAALSLSPSTASVTAGADFNLNLNLDTRNNNIVAVKGVVQYDPADFELRSWNTGNSVFASGNACVYNSKPCEIITEDATNGKITITVAKPTPGVNTASGQVAALTFRAKRAFAATSPNITIHYIAYDNYTDSDVIFDDGQGTDILSEVTNTTVSAVLPVPTGLAANVVSATQINLSWDTPAVNVGVTGYKIFRNGTQVGTSVTNNYSSTGLTPQTAYQYRISSYDAFSHESVQTSQISATTLADTTDPVVPAGLVAGNVTMSSLHLSWTASTDDVEVTGYNIYRNGSKVGTSATAGYDDSGLSPDTTYSYRISAYDAAGNESDQASAITPKTLADTQAPTVPSSVNAQATSMTQVHLSWAASTDNVAVTGYKVFRNGFQVGTSTTTSYDDTGLTASTAYNYRISAYDAKDNESAQSSQVSATTNSDTNAPSVPAGLAGTAASMTQINLNWIASTDNVEVVGYRIFRDAVQVGTSATTSYQDTGLTKSTAYSYAVLAYDAAGNASAQTVPVSITTLADSQSPSVPAGLVATANSMTEVGLSWSASTDNIGVIGYRVYRDGQMIRELADTSYDDTNLTAGTQYSYTISAYDADGNESARSSAVQVTTPTRKYSISDFTALVSDWLQTKASPADVNTDGTINSRDLGIMMSNWQ